METENKVDLNTERKTQRNTIHMNKVKFVAKGNTDLIEKFINYLMHQGKKTVARTVLNDCFAIIEKKTGKKGKEVFNEALENVKPSLEVRAKRIGGSVYQIPMEVKPFRRFQLASRWILAAAEEKVPNGR